MLGWMVAVFISLFLFMTARLEVGLEREGRNGRVGEGKERRKGGGGVRVVCVYKWLDCQRTKAKKRNERLLTSQSRSI